MLQTHRGTEPHREGAWVPDWQQHRCLLAYILLRQSGLPEARRQPGCKMQAGVPLGDVGVQ